MTTTIIDLSEEFLKMAKTIAPGVNFLKMNICDPEFEAGSFDGLWCNLAIQHQKKSDHLQILENYHNLLKPGGALFINTFAGDSEFEHFSENTGKTRLFTLYNLVDLRNILEKSGFSVHMVETYYDGESDMIKVFAIKE